MIILKNYGTKLVKKLKNLKNLAPHEKEILNNEFLKEELIQDRLADAVAYSWKRHQEKIFESMGGLEGIQSVCKQLKEQGLTPEHAKEMTTEQFANYLIEHDIKVK